MLIFCVYSDVASLDSFVFVWMCCVLYPGPAAGWGNRGAIGVRVAAGLCPAPSALQPQQGPQLMTLLLSCLHSLQPALYLDPVLANTPLKSF